MAGKGSYNEIQSMDKGRLLKFILIGAVALVAVVVGLSFWRSAKQEPEKVEAPETVTTTMVPSTIKYYDPGQEKTFDSGVDYIILSDGSQRVKVDSSGNVSYVSDTGQTIGRISGDAADDYINQAVKIMQTDTQAAMALAGLEERLPKEEEIVIPEAPKSNEEALKALLESMGISYEDFIGQVYGIGSSLGDVYTMLAIYDNDEAVINSIMEAKPAAVVEEEPKSISVTVEKLGGTTGSDSSAVTVTDSSYDYPEWMQEQDPTASMTALVESLAALNGSSSGETATTPWEKTNQTEAKTNWLTGLQDSEGSGYSGKLTKWDLAWGTVIPITLVTGLNTDLPGNVIGLVRSDVYDTLTGKNILIPKGSRVIATYNSGVSFGQTSVQIAWTQLITPEGLVYNLPGFQGISQEGYSGVEGKVNNHFWKILGGAVLGSVINYSASVAGNAATNAAQSVGNEVVTGYAEAVAGSTLDTTADYLSQYTSMWMSLKPTITIKTGAQIQMMVNQTVSFKR